MGRLFSGLSVGPVLAVWSCRKITVLGCALMGVGLSVTAFAPSSPYLYAFFSILTGKYIESGFVYHFSVLFVCIIFKCVLL